MSNDGILIGFSWEVDGEEHDYTAQTNSPVLPVVGQTMSIYRKDEDNPGIIAGVTEGTVAEVSLGYTEGYGFLGRWEANVKLVDVVEG